MHAARRSKRYFADLLLARGWRVSRSGIFVASLMLARGAAGVWVRRGREYVAPGLLTSTAWPCR